MTCCGGRSSRLRAAPCRSGQGPDGQQVPRQVARMVTDALAGFQSEGRIERRLEMPRILHRAGEQTPQAGAVLLVELVVARDDFRGELAVQAVERLQGKVQQV